MRTKRILIDRSTYHRLHRAGIRRAVPDQGSLDVRCTRCLVPSRAHDHPARATDRAERRLRARPSPGPITAVGGNSQAMPRRAPSICGSSCFSANGALSADQPVRAASPLPLDGPLDCAGSSCSRLLAIRNSGCWWGAARCLSMATDSPPARPDRGPLTGL